MNDRTRDAFFDSGFQYYAAGRFAAFAGLVPVVGNLLHHAVEMCMKGALSKRGTSLKRLKNLGHSLPLIWQEFKEQYNDVVWENFDDAVGLLNDFEELRYPDSVVVHGMQVRVDIVRSAPLPMAPDPHLAQSSPKYELCLEDMDRLMARIFAAASVTPAFLPGSLSEQARQFLARENAWDLFSDPPKVRGE